MASFLSGLGQGLGAIGAGVGRGELLGSQYEMKARQQKALEDYKQQLLALQGDKLKSSADIAAERINQSQRQMHGRRAQMISRTLDDPEKVSSLQRFPGMLDRLRQERDDAMAVANGQLDWRQVKPSTMTDPITGEVRLPPGVEGPFTGPKPGPWAPGMASGAPWQPQPGQPLSENPYLTPKAQGAQQRVETGQAGQEDTAAYHKGELELGKGRLAIDATRMNADLVDRTFKDNLALAEAKLRQANITNDQQFRVWQDVYRVAAQVAKAGGDPAKDLKPFLFSHGMMGLQVPNDAVIRDFLTRNGEDEATIQKVIQGNPLHGAGRSTMTTPPTGTPTGQPTGAVMGSFQNTSGPPQLPSNQPMELSLNGAQTFAVQNGFRFTSTTGGKHNRDSLHPKGQALDVSVKGKSPAEVQQFMQAAQQQGYGVRDERTKPPGQQVWSGPHVHLEWGPGSSAQPSGAGPAAGPPATGAAPGGPRGDVNATAAGMGINTPATAPKLRSPYSQGTVEDEVFGALTGRNGAPIPAETILQNFQGTPYFRKVADVINRTNTSQQEGLFAGMPVAGTNGAEWPNVPGFTAGQVQIPGAAVFAPPGTTPVVNQGGYGSPPQQPLTMPPSSPIAAPSPPAGDGWPPIPRMGPGPVQGPNRPPPPSPTGAIDLGPWNTGPLRTTPGSPTGPAFDQSRNVPGLAEPGPGATASPNLTQGFVPNDQGEPAGLHLEVSGRPVNVPAPPVVRQSQPGMMESMSQAGQQELGQLQTMPWGGIVDKFLRAKGVLDPEQQRLYHEWVTQRLVPSLMNVPKLSHKAILTMIPSILQKYARPQ